MRRGAFDSPLAANASTIGAMSETQPEGPFDRIPPVDSPGGGPAWRRKPEFIGHTQADRGRGPDADLVANAPRPPRPGGTDESSTPEGSSPTGTSGHAPGGAPTPAGSGGAQSGGHDDRPELPPYGPPQYGGPQFGASPHGAAQFGAPPHGGPQFGAPPHGGAQPGPNQPWGASQPAADQFVGAPQHGGPWVGGSHPGASVTGTRPTPAVDRGITPLVFVGGILGVVAGVVFALSPILPLWTDGHAHGGYWNLFTAPSRSILPAALGGAALIALIGIATAVVSGLAIASRKLRGAALGLGITAAICGAVLLVLGFMLSRSGVGPAFGMWIAVGSAVLCAVAGALQLVGTPKRR